jgi:hypothetical protein
MSNNLFNKNVTGLNVLCYKSNCCTTRCVTHLISASCNAGKQVSLKVKMFPQNLLYAFNAKSNPNSLNASIYTDGYANTHIILSLEVYFI